MPNLKEIRFDPSQIDTEISHDSLIPVIENSVWKMVPARQVAQKLLQTDNAGNIVGLHGPDETIAYPTLKTRIRSGLSRPVAMATGNSIARQSRPGAPDTATNKVDQKSVLYWAMSYARQPFQWARTGAETQVGASTSSTMSRGIHGYSGATSTQILALLPGLLESYRPEVMFLQLMENDPGNVASADALVNYRAAVDLCFAYGCIPIFIGCLPSASWTSAPNSAEFWAITHGVEEMAAQLPGIVYVPVWDLYTDTSGSYPNPLNSGNYANYVDATVHPLRSAALIGRRIAQVLRAHGLTDDSSLTLPGPGDPRYLGGNTLMSGTAGTAGSGMTGTVPTGLTASSTLTSPTNAASIVDVNGRPVLDLVLSASTQSGIKNAASVFGTSSSGYTTGFAEGDYIQTFAEVEFVTAPTGIRCPYLQQSFVGATANDAYCFVMASADTYDIPVFAGERLLLATPEIPVPAGCTGIRPLQVTYASNNAASVSAHIRVHSLAVVNWSK